MCEHIWIDYKGLIVFPPPRLPPPCARSPVHGEYVGRFCSRFRRRVLDSRAPPDRLARFVFSCCRGYPWKSHPWVERVRLHLTTVMRAEGAQQRERKCFTLTALHERTRFSRSITYDSSAFHDQPMKKNCGFGWHKSKRSRRDLNDSWFFTATDRAEYGPTLVSLCFDRR
jgi:hypothetical protein